MTNDETSQNSKDPNEGSSPENPPPRDGPPDRLSRGGVGGYDLEERTSVFGERVVKFAVGIPVNPVTMPLITQLVKAATSVGANYGEANDAESKKDFRHKIGICRKESKECKHFFRMVVAAVPNLRADAAVLWQEAKELNLIFGAIRRRLDDE